MSVRMGQFGRMMDRSVSRKSMEKQMKRAEMMSGVGTKTDKFHRPGVMDNLILAALRFKKKDLTKKTGTSNGK